MRMRCRLLLPLSVLVVAIPILATPVGAQRTTSCDSPGFVLPDTQVVAEPAAGEPSMVWNGAEFAMVWDQEEEDGSYGLYFARIDAGGGLVGDAVRIDDGSDADNYTPSLAWTGAEYGLAWNRYDLTTDIDSICFVRLDSSGTPIGGQVEISTTADGVYEPSLAWSGSEYAVVWDAELEGWEGYPVVFRRLDPDGSPLAAPTVVSDPGSAAWYPSLTWTGAGYAVAWAHRPTELDSRLDLVRVDPAGNRIGDQVTVAGSPVTSLRVSTVWTGTDLGIAWEGADVDQTPALLFARLDAEANVLTSAGVIDPCEADQCPVLDLAWTGSEFGLAWQTWDRQELDETTIRLARVDPAGFRIGSVVERSSDGQVAYPEPLELAWSGSRFAIGWSHVTYPFDLPWPLTLSLVACDCVDEDGDGFDSCAGDCDDANSDISPLGVESCNGADDDCDGAVDEDDLGTDSDGDLVHNLCDNCRDVPNPAQTDTDADGHGDECDNCPLVVNLRQADLDGDLVGDRCDDDDGVITLVFADATSLEWDPEGGAETWDCYRGDLAVLRVTGEYTQAPGSNDLADRFCGVASTTLADPTAPAPGTVAYYLLAGVIGGEETGLGVDGSGTERPNDNACP